MSDMVRVYGLLWAIGLILWIFCLIDSITSREDRVRNLPKVAWVIIVLLFPFVGSIAWIVAGRPQPAASPEPSAVQTQFPEYDRPGRATASDPERDAEFLRQVRERAEEQRRVYREQQAQKRAEEEAGHQERDGGTGE